MVQVNGTIILNNRCLYMTTTHKSTFFSFEVTFTTNSNHVLCGDAFVGGNSQCLHCNVPLLACGILREAIHCPQTGWRICHLRQLMALRSFSSH
ncbi:hypothetical protein BLOT_008398 [Blomia tropicalis]|nr:hypothetical protein BLOT_008398 [Blomia tropicalis]